MDYEEKQAPQKIILVIDDEAPVREAVTDVMDMIDVQVLAAENGRVAISLYQERMADIELILLDLSMPGLSGLETLAKLRQLNPQVKVIISSGYSAQDRVPAADEITIFLQKPYDVNKLIKLVSNFLR